MLTARGLEVESCEPAASVAGIRAARIDAVRPHPSAAKLKLCEVDAGSGKAEVVCGAPNVRTGMLAAFAPPGAQIGGQTLSPRNIRGAASEGMLCSAREIGAGEDSGGLLELDPGEAAPGDSLDAHLLLSDAALDVSITPNRGDCLSHLGVAREIAAARGARLPPWECAHEPDSGDAFSAEIVPEAAAACPYYGCVTIRGANAARPSPAWMRSLLERCGLRAVNAAVDITNYVMLATGQPLHAFDMDKLHDGIVVRPANAGETIELLDGRESECQAGELLIADRRQPAALAGVMGGMASAVSETTKNILLEGAFFAPQAVRGRAGRHGVSSEAAFRFERGVDPLLPPRALALGAKLMREICGGKAGPLISAGKAPPPAAAVSAPAAWLRGFIGMPEITAPRAADLLNSLGIDSSIDEAPSNGEGDGTVVCKPPSWRFDIELPADIAEEVIRAWGYDSLPETPPPGGRGIPPLPPRPFAPTAARRRLAAAGFSEIVTFAFVPPQWEEMLQTGRGEPVQLKNPINSGMSVMRTTLLGGLIDRAVFNMHHKRERLRLFEIGRCFVNGAGAADDEKKPGRAWRQAQPLYVAGIALGEAAPPQWGQPRRECDFFDMKGWMEAFLRPAAGATFEKAGERPNFMHPGQSINILCDGETLGTAGALHPRIAAGFGFREPPLVFEINLQPLAERRILPRTETVSHFPPVRRDLSVVAGAPAGEVLEQARAAAAASTDAACETVLFDRYEGDGVEAGKTCYGIRLLMQSADRSLAEEDIQKTLSAVVEALAGAGMTLRQ